MSEQLPPAEPSPSYTEVVGDCKEPDDFEQCVRDAGESLGALTQRIEYIDKYFRQNQDLEREGQWQYWMVNFRKNIFIWRDFATTLNTHINQLRVGVLPFISKDTISRGAEQHVEQFLEGLISVKKTVDTDSKEYVEALRHLKDDLSNFKSTFEKIPLIHRAIPRRRPFIRHFKRPESQTIQTHHDRDSRKQRPVSLQLNNAIAHSAGEILGKTRFGNKLGRESKNANAYTQPPESLVSIAESNTVQKEKRKWQIKRDKSGPKSTANAPVVSLDEKNECDKVVSSDSPRNSLPDVSRLEGGLNNSQVEHGGSCESEYGTEHEIVDLFSDFISKLQLLCEKYSGMDADVKQLRTILQHDQDNPLEGLNPSAIYRWIGGGIRPALTEFALGKSTVPSHHFASQVLGDPEQTGDPISPLTTRTNLFARMQGLKQRPGSSSVARNSASEPQSESSPINSVDLCIEFLSAHILSTKDPARAADICFTAKLESKIEYMSITKQSTLEPIWNEKWHIKNVPITAVLKVKVYNKGSNNDGSIGKFKIPIGESGPKEGEIENQIRKDRGRFKLHIMSSACSSPTTPPYTLAGPCRYSRHRSPATGTPVSTTIEERVYWSWKISLLGIPKFFGENWQPWDIKDPATEHIFRPPNAVRGIVQKGHHLLYASKTVNASGVLGHASDFVALFRDEGRGNKIKPTIYTYIIDEDTFRFSENRAAFLVDFPSKHALHSKCAAMVRYCGEFHWRPADGGWASHNEQTDDSLVDWEIVMDNNSSAYSPDKNLLPDLCRLIEHNFPGLKVSALDREDDRLRESIADCRAYGKSHRGIDEFEFYPHTNNPKERTLFQMASSRRN